MKVLLALCFVWFTTSAFSTTTCPDFSVLNNTHQNLGTVILAGTGGSTNIDVPDAGLYKTAACFTVSTATINGQTTTYPNSMRVTTASGATVKVNWQSQGEIVIIDYLQQNSMND